MCICALCSRLDTSSCLMTMDMLNKLQGIGVTGIGCPHGEESSDGSIRIYIPTDDPKVSKQVKSLEELE